MGMNIEGDRDKDGAPNKDNGRMVRISPGSHTGIAELTFSRSLVSAWGQRDRSNCLPQGRGGRTECTMRTTGG